MLATSSAEEEKYRLCLLFVRTKIGSQRTEYPPGDLRQLLILAEKYYEKAFPCGKA